MKTHIHAQQTATLHLPFAPIIITPPVGGEAQRQFWYLRLRSIRGQAKALEIQRRALLQEAAAIERHFETDEGIDTEQ